MIAKKIMKILKGDNDCQDHPIPVSLEPAVCSREATVRLEYGITELPKREKECIQRRILSPLFPCLIPGATQLTETPDRVVAAESKSQPSVISIPQIQDDGHLYGRKKNQNISLMNERENKSSQKLSTSHENKIMVIVPSFSSSSAPTTAQ